MVLPGLQMLPLTPGLLAQHDDGRFQTDIFGFTPGSRLELPVGFTHFGVVVEGEILLYHGDRQRHLVAGDYFSVIGPARIRSQNGLGMVSSARGYIGLNTFGGPLEEEGRLAYINSASDTLLVPPIRRGNPCFNLLCFKPNTVQTHHTHPSVRVNIVFSGEGVCLIGEARERVPLLPGYAFLMEPETLHSFNTEDSPMRVLTFHPDSDVGMTDDNHPMLNRTEVDGLSARLIPEIQTPRGAT